VYGLALHDAPHRITWRRLFVLIRQLPQSSRVVAAMTAGDSDWSRTDHLLALLFDAIQGGNWQRGGGKGPQPDPLERPGVTPKRKVIKGGKYTEAEMRRLLDLNTLGKEVD